MPVVDQENVDELRGIQGKKPRLSTLYGMDSIFRLVYDIPFYIPVAQTCLLEHGVNFQFSLFFERLIESKDELIFLDNSHRVNEFEKQTGKKAYPIGPLYPKYRKLKNILPKPDRKGTLAFPSHSSSQFDFSEGYTQYAQDLLKLPEQYHPITICLYYYDVLQGHHTIFADAGFQVITNGYVGDPAFVDHLYDNISSHQYITSNHAGSYAFYALEMGIPFFLYGEGIEKLLLNLGIINEMKMEDFIKNDFMNRFTGNMVFDIHQEIRITEELIKCVHLIMDEKQILSIDEVNALVKRNWLKFLISKVFKNIRNKLRSKLYLWEKPND